MVALNFDLLRDDQREFEAKVKGMTEKQVNRVEQYSKELKVIGKEYDLVKKLLYRH